MIKLNQSAEELAARKRVSVEVRGCFACSESARKKAWKAVLALRPGRKKGRRLRLTYIDIFYDGLIFMGEFEYSLIKWRGSNWSGDG
jgi:hypothetical protein